jgi:Brp/Blh family beta-carotene 15,15'-monooxygenase
MATTKLTGRRSEQMNALRIQGLAFSVGAIVLAIVAVAAARLDPQVELIVVATLIVLLGVPHGALDTIFARQLYGIQTLGGWLRFAVIYVLLGASVVGFFMLAPSGFLIGFLLISILHFSGDPAAGTPWLARALYGGAIIVLPTLLYAGEITRLFALLVGIDAATLVTPFLSLLAWPWLIGLALAAIQRLQKDWLTALEMSAVAVLAVLAPPLISFTVFFCAMHSARHILRTIDYSGRSSPRLILGATLLPMLGVLVASAAASYFLGGTPINGAIIQLVFVGLAALTVPHMALVERVRLSGWVTGSAIRRG